MQPSQWIVRWALSSLLWESAFYERPLEETIRFLGVWRRITRTDDRPN